MNYPHCGLYFTPEHVQIALQDAEREPFKSAWSFLTNYPYADDPQSPATLIMNGFGYRLGGGIDPGEDAVLTLQSGYSLDPTTYPTAFDALAGAVTLAQAIELVRDHPRWTADSLARWLADYAHLADRLQTLPDDSGIVEHLWLGLLNVVSGIVLENDDRFAVGVEIFQQTIQSDIRPEGHLPRAVEGGDGGSFQRDFFSVMALVGVAEAASHVGIDLWSYESRGISVNTAAAYITYYYYYPDQWRWDDMTEEVARPFYKDNGAFFEMVNRRTRPHDLKLLLDEQRPLFTPALGGLTTLTHGLPAKARRGLFG